jgi:hypothetical protein
MLCGNRVSLQNIFVLNLTVCNTLKDPKPVPAFHNPEQQYCSSYYITIPLRK